MDYNNIIQITTAKSVEKVTVWRRFFLCTAFFLRINCLLFYCLLLVKLFHHAGIWAKR